MHIQIVHKYACHRYIVLKLFINYNYFIYFSHIIMIYQLTALLFALKAIS